jgi:positive regulator of sigma E activity
MTSIRTIFFVSLLFFPIDVFAAPDNIHYIMDFLMKIVGVILAIGVGFLMLRYYRKKKRDKED